MNSIEKLKYLGKKVKVEFNSANCPKANSCSLACYSHSPIGYEGIIEGISYGGERESNILYFHLDNGDFRWACRCKIIEDVIKKDYPGICPKCKAPAYVGMFVVDCSVCGKSS